MIKVAFFADILSEDFDGASRTMNQIISRVDATKFDYFYITGHDELGYKANLNVFTTKSLKFPLQKRYKIALPHLQNRTLKKQLDTFKPDVIHISTPSFLGRWAIQYAKKNKIPVISIFHTFFSSYIQYYFDFWPALASRLIRLANNIQKKFYNKCDIVYVPSQSMKEELQKIGVKSQKIHIWARGIDNQLFSPSKRDEAYIEKITGNSHKNLLFVSRLVWEKNLDMLIKVYNILQHEMKLEFNMIIAGSGHAESDLRKQMKGSRFLGTLNHKELSKLYASSDLLFFPSISETFGNVVLEGLSSGIPAVVADSGGTQDMIADGHNGFVVKADDAYAMADRIRILFTNDAALSIMKEHAVASSESYRWPELTHKYFQQIRDLASLT